MKGRHELEDTAVAPAWGIAGEILGPAFECLGDGVPFHFPPSGALPPPLGDARTRRALAGGPGIVAVLVEPRNNLVDHVDGNRKVAKLPVEESRALLRALADPRWRALEHPCRCRSSGSRPEQAAEIRPNQSSRGRLDDTLTGVTGAEAGPTGKCRSSATC